MRHITRSTWIVLGAMAWTALCLLISGETAQAQNDPLKSLPRLNALEFNREAVAKSLPLLQNSATVFVQQTGGKCFSCHHQTLPSLAVAYARSRGFAVDEKRAKEQIKLVHDTFALLRPLAEKAQTSKAAETDLDRILVDPGVSIAYMLTGLAADRVQPDDALAAAVGYLMRKQAPDGSWSVWTPRPPLQSSAFTATAFAVHALQVYAPKSRQAEAQQRIARARRWLRTTRPKTTEDKAFRLYGLSWTHAGSAEIQSAVSDVLALQQDDGGWGQTPNAPSDAYATGQVLVALHQAGGLAVDGIPYRRGAFFLVVTQKEDGSWRVVKRAVPVQTFFDAKFPHGADQFISCAGTSWAVMALALTLPKTEPVARLSRF